MNIRIFGAAVALLAGACKGGPPRENSAATAASSTGAALGAAETIAKNIVDKDELTATLGITDKGVVVTAGTNVLSVPRGGGKVETTTVPLDATITQGRVWAKHFKGGTSLRSVGVTPAESFALPGQLQKWSSFAISSGVGAICFLDHDGDHGQSVYLLNEGKPPRLIAKDLDRCSVLGADADSFTFTTMTGDTVSLQTLDRQGVGKVLTTSMLGVSRSVSDGKTIFFASGSELFAVPKSGGERASLVSGVDVEELRLDADQLYYLQADTNEAGQTLHSIVRINKQGKDVTVLVKDAAIKTFTVDNESVYWIDGTDLKRAAKPKSISRAQ